MKNALPASPIADALANWPVTSASPPLTSVRSWSIERIGATRAVTIMRTGEADEVVCAAMPHPFRAVGLWYEDFPQATDDEVHDLLEEARREQAMPAH